VAAALCVATLAACTSSHRTSAGAKAAAAPGTAASGSTPISAAAVSAAAVSAAAVSAGPRSDPPAAAASSEAASSPADVPSPLAVAAPTPSASPSTKPTPSPTKPATPTATGTPTATPLLVQELANIGNAQQVVIVTSSSWSTDVATLQTFEKDAGVWHAVFPAMAANIGRDGFSADKHEGDLKTPAGKYGFGTMFGQQPSPGVKFPYRVADSQSVWVDTPSSPYYNTWREDVPLGQGEDLDNLASYGTAYAYAVDIAYNTDPVVPGKGSAIFLHVTTGGGTAGCVSLAKVNLLEVLRWLDPARAPVIVMGPTSAIRQY
jgi:L,D-peptidoglycan transpeptidase YkuD (ErfK/YbiS/YcfS/YnhG family)